MKLKSTCLNTLSGLRTKSVSFATIVASIIIAGAVSADTLNSVVSAEQKKLLLAQQSQQRVNSLSDQRKDLYQQFKAVSKEVEGLKIYNKQLSKQILNQRTEMQRIRDTIENVQVTERQIPPLMLRMVENLASFVALDMPFLQSERQARIDRLVELMDKSNISKAEKFRAVIQAYQIENEYGNTIEKYSEKLDVGGQERNVNILRFGRISMVYQTPDGKHSGFWNQESGQWEVLTGGSERSYISKGIKIADKQAAPDLIILPAAAPVEAAQ